MGVEKFAPSLESLSSLGFEEGSWDVPGIWPGCPGPVGVFKKFVQKKFMCIFRSLKARVSETTDSEEQAE